VRLVLHTSLSDHDSESFPFIPHYKTDEYVLNEYICKTQDSFFKY
jgi:hypothetical protein